MGKRQKARVRPCALEQTVEGSVLHLKGAVEIKTSRVVVQADEATFDVASGLIEANGNIRLMKAGSRTPPRPVAQVKRMRMDVNKPDLVILMVADAAAPARL